MTESPWRRPESYLSLPPRVDVEHLHALAPEEFARMLRDHLLPRSPDERDRNAWLELWDVLSSSSQLADRAFDVLEEFLDRVEAALDAGSLPDWEAKRARRFRNQVEDAWE